MSKKEKVDQKAAKNDNLDKTETMGDSDSTQNEAKKPVHRKRRLFFYLILLVVAIGVLVDAYPFGPPKVSEETTVLTEPLTLDGNGVDYVAAVKALVPKNAGSDENGARLLVQGFGPEFFLCHEGLGSFGLMQRSNEMCEFFGLAEGDEPIVSFTTPYDAYDAFLQERLPGKDKTNEREAKLLAFNRFSSITEEVTSWDDDRVEFLESWCRDNQGALDLVAQAVQKNMFAFPALPYGKVEGVPFLAVSAHGPIEGLSLLVRSLRVHANYMVRIGNIEAAVNDVVAMHLLAKHVVNSQTNSLIPFIIGTGMQGAASDVNLNGNPDVSVTKEQWQRVYDACGNPSYTKCFDQVNQIVRFGILDYLQTLGHYNLVSPYDRKADPPRKKNYAYRFLLRIAYDWNYVMMRANYLFDNTKELDALLADEASKVKSKSLVERLPLKKARSDAFVLNVMRELEPIQRSAKQAFHRYVCNVRMQKIAIAMQMYLCDHGTFPPAFTVDENGNRLHSWRVLILPYVGQQELYDKIRLDEPWDSEYNRQFHNVDMLFYECPAIIDLEKERATGELSLVTKGATSYSVLTGPNSLFDNTGKGKDPKSLAKSESTRDILNMALVVERAQPFCWMNPNDAIEEGVAIHGINVNGDLTQEVSQETRMVPCLESLHKGGINIAMVGGAVLFIPDTLEVNELEHLILGAPLPQRVVAIPETTDVFTPEEGTESAEEAPEKSESAEAAKESEEASTETPAETKEGDLNASQEGVEGADAGTETAETTDPAKKENKPKPKPELVKPSVLVPEDFNSEGTDLDSLKKSPEQIAADKAKKEKAEPVKENSEGKAGDSADTEKTDEAAGTEKSDAPAENAPAESEAQTSEVSPAPVAAP